MNPQQTAEMRALVKKFSLAGLITLRPPEPPPVKKSRRIYTAIELRNRMRISVRDCMRRKRSGVDLRRQRREKNAATILALDALKAAVAQHFNIHPRWINAREQWRQFHQPRFAFYLLARERGYSLQAIGRSAGKRDHGTILFAISQAKDLIDTNPQFAAAINHLRNLRVLSAT